MPSLRAGPFCRLMIHEHPLHPTVITAIVHLFHFHATKMFKVEIFGEGRAPVAEDEIFMCVARWVVGFCHGAFHVDRFALEHG